MTNDTPPRACLADFGFMAMVLNPGNPMSSSATLEGGTKMFMSPELLVPSKFGFKDSIPTPQADIYAFGMVIFQVCLENHRCGPSTQTFQILTGGLPFYVMRETELVCLVVEGLRPKEPENASAIGFSDSLWDFVQRCWHGKIEMRPQAADLVAHLGRAAREWNRPMPPHVEVEGAISTPKGPISGSTEHRKLEGLIFP